MHLMKDIAGVEMPKYFGSLVGEEETPVDLIQIRNKIIDLRTKEKFALESKDYSQAENFKEERIRLSGELQKKILAIGSDDSK